MFHLARIFPGIKRISIPLIRDQLILLIVAVNEIFLSIDIYLAHSISGTIVPREWIPIIFGMTAGIILLVAGAISWRYRALAQVLATLVFLASAIVGILGAYFHVVRGIMPTAPAGQQITINLLVWAPPVVGPLMFGLIGWIGISAAWVESSPDSGSLILLGDRRLNLPYSKTRAYFFMVSLGILATLISSVLDHARTSFTNPWLWVPTIIGVFATCAAFVLAAIDIPSKNDLWVYTVSMFLLIAVGLVGMWLHINENLIADGRVITERFIRGAPFLAPTLYSNLGLIGLIVLLNPREGQ